MDTSPNDQPSSIYTGVWTNWSHGRFLGRTLTLSRQDGDMLIALVALFVTIVGTSFWRVTCFAIHLYYSSEAPQDGVYHQRQAILRNSANGASGLWHLIRTVWAWRRNGATPATRVAPVIAHATLCLFVFGAASGYSSKISTSVGNEVLISNAIFGVPDTTNLGMLDQAMRLYPLRNESRLAGCDIFVKPYLASQITRDASCPFKSRICRSNDKNIYLDTGLLDIQSDFGMNVPPSQRIQFRAATHCAPLKTEGYKKNFPATEQSVPDTGAKYTSPALAQYDYGESLLIGNITYEYPEDASIPGHTDTPSYTIDSRSAYPHNGSFGDNSAQFVPNEDLVRMDADLDLVFLSANGVLFADQVDDPWYSAHVFRGPAGAEISAESMRVYLRDEPAAVLGCVKQFQICNPRLPKAQNCTPLQGYLDLQANAKDIFQSEEEALWLHFSLTSRLRELPQLSEIISILGHSSLASSYSYYGGIQAPLPDYQWQLDVEHWHSIYLAGLQGSAVEIAEGPSDPKLRKLMQRPRNKQQEAFCRAQKILSNKHTNFSVLGLALIFATGSFIILLSWFIEPLFAFIQKRRNLDAYARLEWTTNEVLQLQRMAHEQLEMGTWSSCDAEVPITERGEKLAILDLGNLKHPRLLALPKGFEHELAEPQRNDLETGGRK